MMASPNFPEHLDINPSVYSQLSSSEELRPADENPNAALFGDHAQRLAIKKYGIAGRVWEAAYLLNIYVNPSPIMEFDPPFIDGIPPSSPRTILELGSGTGIVCSNIAKTLDRNKDIIIATDLPEVCPLLENNLKEYKAPNSYQRSSNDTTNVYIRPLSWGDEGHFIRIADEFFAENTSQTTRRLSHVVCSDLVYFPELLGPLLRTLIRLTSPFIYPRSAPSMDVSGGPVVIISYKIRSLPKETLFWSAFGLWFEFKPILVKDTTPGSRWQRFGQSLRDDAMFVFVAHRHPGSCAWEIPTSDQELLEGGGARGDNTAKGDDTFETLLFMALGESQ